MADLTLLDAELAEVLGFAQAGQVATRKVAALARRENRTRLLELMHRMGDEAAQMEERCDLAVATREGTRTAIAVTARQIKAEVIEFMEVYLEGADAIKGLEFLRLTESGEMAHWIILTRLTEIGDDRSVASVVEFALPLQRGHVFAVREHSLRLAEPVRSSESYRATMTS